MEITESGLKASRSPTSRDVDPDDFVNTVNSMSKKERDLFKAVHGQSASGMVENAKENYNKSLQKKANDGMSKNIE